MIIDHIGYAVKKIDKALKGFQNLGYVFENLIEDTDRNIILCFGNKDGYRIELVQPLDKDKPSPVDAFLSKIGPTPYHICYVSDSFEEDIAQLESQGFRVVISPQKAVAFQNKRVVFMMNLGLGLMEIVEKTSGVMSSDK